MYKDTLRQAWIEIDLSALEYNVKNIKEKLGRTCEIIGVVKADAYGHGSVRCAEVLRDSGVNSFAVATIEEALVLRDAGFDEPIVILGLIPSVCADIVAENNLTPVISSLESAIEIAKAAETMGKRIDCLIAIDTGMGRIGYRVEDEEDVDFAEKEIASIDELDGIRIIGLLSHFSSSDEEDREYTRKQLRLFNDFYERIAADGYGLPWLTIANSAAVIGYSCSAFNAARPGIILYGCYPSNNVDKKELSIKPVMSVKANIVHIKKIPKGTAVSYGRKFVAERESLIATLAIGYADGYSRLLTGKAEVLVKGKRVPVVGSICMDQCMIDVTDVPEVTKSDEVIIMGSDGKNTVSAEELADKEGTINYEVLVNFGMRLPKVYKK